MPVCSRKSKDPLAAGATMEGDGGGNKGRKMMGQSGQSLVGPVEDFAFTLREVGGGGRT